MTSITNRGINNNGGHQDASGQEDQQPPPYATDNGSNQSTQSNLPTAASARLRLDLWNTRSGFNVTHGREDHQLYHIRRYNEVNKPDLVLYGGYDFHGPQLAVIKFVNFTKSFGLYFGGARKPADGDYDVVRCASTVGALRGPEYRFEIEDATATGSGKRERQRLHWRQTKENVVSKLFPTRDYTLIDEANDEIVAVYTEHSFDAYGKLKGTLEMRAPLNENAQIAALLIVMAILEKMRRKLGVAGRQGLVAKPAWMTR